jgi:NAD-dependent SIR2 family protein deacetylase
MRMRPVLEWPLGGDVLAPTGELDDVHGILAAGRVAVLSGAGLSTESGIPDYRGATGSLRRHTPMTYEDFVHSRDGRRRYWARSYLGWRTITRARPNAGHAAVAALSEGGYVSSVITQNVDGLHRAAGNPDAVELHGSLDRVVCLSCGRFSARVELDRRLRAANPHFAQLLLQRDRENDRARVNPDGDIELADELVAAFRTVDCEACGTGVLKPDVVFFGENVPKARVQQCYELIDQARSLLVLGSSLTVMSGLRFVRYAAKNGKPVAIVNQGPTRGDEHAAVRLDAPLGATLTWLADQLGCESELTA